MIQLFSLIRDEDLTGISGEGKIAEGCEFSSGKCALSWLTEFQSVALYDNIESIVAIHGHNGITRVIYDESQIEVTDETGKY